MSNERNGYRNALVPFAIAVISAILVAFVTTFERGDTTFERGDNKASVSETAPGTTGLAKAHPPLDRAPGQPLGK